MYRRYYSYNDMPTVSKRSDGCGDNAKKDDCCDKCDSSTIVPVHNQCSECQDKSGGLTDGLIQNGKILGKFEVDDVLLLVVILILVLDDCDDNLLLIALGFIFISGIL